MIGISFPISQEETSVNASKFSQINPTTEFTFKIDPEQFSFYLEDERLVVEGFGQKLHLNPYNIKGTSNFKLYLASWSVEDGNVFKPPSDCKYLLLKLNNPIERFTDLECVRSL